MAEQLFQIGVKGLIRNHEGNILMVHLPKWGDNSAHWDLPGGRIDPGETLLQTLKRELQEEIGVSYKGKPTQLLTILTNIKIPVENNLLPLVFVIYAVEVANIRKIKLSKNIREDKIVWFPPKKAADLMSFKFTADFRDLVKSM